jgi:GNAT superfamily N-acetyltransferase
MATASVRPATPADLTAIAAVTAATDQLDDWAGGNPDYVRHLMSHGQVVVAELNGPVAGFGATLQLGTGPDAVSMLCDLFVDPAAQGAGCGRAMLSRLWPGTARRMTFSSLHASAVPLYASFGLDPWWPLLYLRGDIRRLPSQPGWEAERSSASQAAAAELHWTGIDRSADHRAWAAQPAGGCVLVRQDGELAAAGTVMNGGTDRGIVHLSMPPAAGNDAAAAAVLTVLAGLEDPAAEARACLPGPHPAVRQLLAAGWRLDEFDLFMATEPGLMDPSRAVPSPGQA